jgi:galactokinase
MKEETIEIINRKFSLYFGEEGTFYTAPGRINLIGEHTDYNGGFVFPGAVDKGIVAKIRPNWDRSVRVYSVDMDSYLEFGIDPGINPYEPWGYYIFGVYMEAIKRYGKDIPGIDAVFAGDVPLGAGMSSSAALESTFAYAINDIFQLGFDKLELARIGQAAEHNYCGVNCGIMDQFASIFGKAGSLIRLDCRSMEYKYFPFHPKGYRLVLLDSVVKHELASSAYNRRRASCETVVAAVKAAGHPSVEYLRDVDMAMLAEVKGKVSDEDYMRAEYVIEEIQRVLDVCDALERDDYETVGAKMYETHHGMSRLYEVSCPELDFLNDLARECGVTGSRVMGGGFGGCTINLVKDSLYDEFIERAVREYAAQYGHEPKVYPVIISDGARRLE